MATPIDLTDKNYFGSANVAKDSIVLNDRYFYIDGSTVVEYSDKVSSFKAQLIDKDGVDVKAGGDAKGLIADGKSATFYFLSANATATTGVKASDLKDGIFVAIVKTEVVDTNKPITPATDATWSWTLGSNKGENLPAVIGADDKGNVTITLYNDATTAEKSTTKTATAIASTIEKRNSNGGYDAVPSKATATFKDAVLTVTGYTDAAGLAFDLTSGTYKVTFTFVDADNAANLTVTYFVTVK